MGKRKTKTCDTSVASSEGGLSLCRNKHWRYISAYHGNWLSLPIEVLECIALQNWQLPAPRAIEPGVLFDVLKIRRLVDLAAEDAVRATSGTSNIGSKSGREYMSLTADLGGQMSKQRVFKIRQKACNSLYEAFELDEIAASVASMASTSTLEAVAQHVLRHDLHDLHAKYVHFFHEKIPSRAMSEHTTLELLDDVLRRLPWEAQLAPLRTRAGVQAYKAEYAGAITDYCTAIRILDDIARLHKQGPQQIELASTIARETIHSTNRPSRQALPQEDDRPTGMEMQLVFGRGSAYLNLALQSIEEALGGMQRSLGEEATGRDARKRVKSNAKRALKDFLVVLSRLEYTPGSRTRSQDSSHGVEEQASVGRCDVPLEADGRALTSKKDNAHETRLSSSSELQLPGIAVFTADMLFAEKLSPQLSLHLDSIMMPVRSVVNTEDTEPCAGEECVTYHPLLIEAIHLLLLAHALLQTSPTELRRHCMSAARLCNLAKGSPIFQLARSPARADWSEVLRSANDWIGLGASWQDVVRSAQTGRVAKVYDTNQHNLLKTGVEHLPNEAMIDILSDDRVVDEKTFHQALQASQTKTSCIDGSDAALQERTSTDGAGLSPATQDFVGGSATMQQEMTGVSSNSTQRAQLVTRWVREAPLSSDAPRKKRAAHKRKTAAAEHAGTLTDSVTSLTLSNGDDGPD